MSEKRFFEIDYDEIYYIVDSSKLKRKKDDFEDEEDFEQYCLENSLIGTQVVDLLNTLHQENQQLKHYKLYEDNKRLQTIIADLKDDKNQLHKLISKLRQEVAELKTRNSVLSSKLNQIPKSIKEVWLE